MKKRCERRAEGERITEKEANVTHVCVKVKMVNTTKMR